MDLVGDSTAQWLANLLPGLGSIPVIPKIFSEETIVDVADVNKWRYLEES